MCPSLVILVSVCTPLTFLPRDLLCLPSTTSIIKMCGSLRLGGPFSITHDTGEPLGRGTKITLHFKDYQVINLSVMAVLIAKLMQNSNSEYRRTTTSYSC